ncbi:hypothetical protein F0266_24965 [Vibrio coralliilyticus]|uniref:hypothetical protein n=1 Tax=Vibrio coralliilyticus TaxID=190893 RepID=UPI00148C8F4B|nr:hypothetical protein [Vibrio coralliilyticus]NOH56171.1 hypothetical protein [Vibrio coralliilyticus]
MKNYVITPELSLYIDKLKAAESYVELFVEAINYALEKEGQPSITTQHELDEFVRVSGLSLAMPMPR